MSSLKIVRLVHTKKLHSDAVLPTPKPGDVGFDLSSVEDVICCHPGRVAKIPTGLALAKPMITQDNNSLFFKVEGRSGLASKGLFPVGGIIDPSYRGEIAVLLFNSTDAPYVISKGDRIAQLVCYNVLAPNENIGVKFIETEELQASERADSGFGSSGK